MIYASNLSQDILIFVNFWIRSIKLFLKLSKSFLQNLLKKRNPYTGKFNTLLLKK